MGTAVAVSDPRVIRKELVAFTPRMIEVVGLRGADEYVARQLNLAMLKIKDSPALQKCSVESIATALIRLCGDRLDVGTTAHLVPMQGQCVYMRDWKGDVELMIRSGHVRDVKPYAVHERDHFREYVRAGADCLDWEPAAGDRGPLVAVFALAKLRYGHTTHEVMRVAEVDAIRARAPMPNSPGWRDHYVEMAKKTVIHRIGKRLPKGALPPDDSAATLGLGEPADALPRGHDGYTKMLATPQDDPYGVAGQAADGAPQEQQDHA